MQMKFRQPSFFLIVGYVCTALWLPSPGIAQESQSVQEISGVVKDATGGVMPGVQVSIPDLKLSADTDNSGRYTLKNVPAGKMILQASLPGFSTKQIEAVVQPGQNLKLDFVLEVQARSDTVTVEYSAPKLMTASDSIGSVTISPAQVAALPSLGEKDIFRSLQLMPGISATNESSSGLYVRGGTPDQNLVLFDGFTVYKVDHFFGIFSAFNANAVESTTLLKGGFDAKYGGRISSVVDLAGKTSNKKAIEFGGGASLLSLNGYVDGPLGKKGTFMIAARRSYPSPFSKKIRDKYNTSATAGPGGRGGGPMGNFSSEPTSWFYDVNARATYSPGPKDMLVLSSFYGKDNFDNSRTIQMPSFGANQNRSLNGEITDLSKWGNLGTSLSWRRTWTSAFTSQLTTAYSRYFKNSDNSSKMTVVDPDTNEERVFETGSTEANHLSDITVRLANSLALGRRNYTEFGAEATRNKVDYDYTFNQDIGQLHRTGEGRQQALYIQNRFQPFSKLEITPGIRATRFNRVKQTFLEPRASLIFHVNDNIRFKAAGGRYHQFINNLTREDPMGGDQDFWTLADGESVPVSQAYHYIAGASYENASYLFDVEAYRKDLSGLTQFGMFRPGIRPPGFPGREPGSTPANPEGRLDFTRTLFNGSGRALGLDFLAQKKFGAYTGWISYTLGNVREFFPDIEYYSYPASHDSTHEVKIVNSYQWKRFTFSGNWVYATGKPITEPTGAEEVTGPNDRIFYIPQYGSKNGARLPNYHRLDVSASWEFYRGEGNWGQTGVSIFNAYGHDNVWRRQYQFADGEMITTDVKYLGLTFSAFVNLNLEKPPADRSLGPAWVKPEPSTADNRKTSAKPGKEYDFYGTIVAISSDRVSMSTSLGTKEFILARKAFLGEPNYEKGAYVHVYYQDQAEGNVVTRLVRKVKDAKDVPTRNVEPLDPLRPWRF
jgi:ferric enterobactin receptor